MTTRASTVSRIVSALSLPAEDVFTIAPGLVAVRPNRLAAIRAAYSDQSWFGWWLDRQLTATRITRGSMTCTVIHKAGAAVGLSSALRYATVTSSTHSYVELDSGGPISPKDFLSSGVAGRVQIDGAVSMIMTGLYRNDGADIPSNGTNPIIPSGAVVANASAVSTFKLRRTSAWGVPMNATKTYWIYGSTIRAAIPSALPYSGNPATAGMTSMSPYELALTAPESDQTIEFADWPLIMGPSALTRGEYYSNGFEWLAVNSVDMSDLLTKTLESMTDANAKNKVIIQRDALLARGADAFLRGKLNAGMNAFEMSPLTSIYAGTLMDQTGTRDSVNFDAVNAISTAGVVTSSVALEESADTLIDPFPDVSQTPELVFEPGVNATLTGYATPIALASARDLIVALRQTGRTVTLIVGLVSRFTAPDQALIADAQAGLTANLTELTETLTLDGDGGAVGTAFLMAGLAPLTTKNRDLVNSMLTPGYLDAMMALQ